MGRKPTKTSPQSTRQKTISCKEMVRLAILGLKDKQGSSKKEILNYITANFNVGNDAGKKIETELRQGVKDGTIVKCSKGKSRTRLFRAKNSKKKSTEKSAAKNVKEGSKKTITKKVRFEDEIMKKVRLSVKVEEAKEERTAAAIAKTEAAKKNKSGRRKKKNKCSNKPSLDAAPKTLSDRAIDAKIFAFFDEIWQNM